MISIFFLHETKFLATRMFQDQTTSIIVQNIEITQTLRHTL